MQPGLAVPSANSGEDWHVTGEPNALSLLIFQEEAAAVMVGDCERKQSVEGEMPERCTYFCIYIKYIIYM